LRTRGRCVGRLALLLNTPWWGGSKASYLSRAPGAPKIGSSCATLRDNVSSPLSAGLPPGTTVKHLLRASDSGLLGGVTRSSRPLDLLTGASPGGAAPASRWTKRSVRRAFALRHSASRARPRASAYGTSDPAIEAGDRASVLRITCDGGLALDATADHPHLAPVTRHTAVEASASVVAPFERLDFYPRGRWQPAGREACNAASAPYAVNFRAPLRSTPSSARGRATGPEMDGVHGRPELGAPSLVGRLLPE